ncbi:MAG: Cysteine desulfurase [uncultured Rubrobacteraceae bacterium]|uniref:Cysteine desulfurase n=1 Tax=uncultured Rubrobacteraceae bacterium TaxID=349277 RepID=A0A6J4QXC9_9ACTN|nr:MAG: Cysteine desulfurase [uncultured Rubrobacteraceae bacterium]
MPDPVYLDNAATTPVDPRVLEAMLPHLGATRGNPSSLHARGVAAREAVEAARGHVAALLGASPEEIFFTAGGTEADNVAVFGLARAADPGKRHAVVSGVEHAAVREAARRLEAEGFEVSWVGVDEYGLVDPAEFAAALRPDTALASVVWANNEIGTVQPVRELADACARRGIPFHTDAVQAAGRLSLDVREAAVSTLAISGHKIYGPQGVGALYVRGGTDIEPVVFGGGQEQGLRSGTENVAGIAGLGEAARLAREELGERVRHEAALRDRVISGVRGLPDVELNGHPELRLSNNAHFTVRGVGAESLVLVLDSLGYAIGSGSACSGGGHQASGVLLALGRDEQDALSAARITVGKDNTAGEVDGFLEAFAGAVGRLRELSPVYAG